MTRSAILSMVVLVAGCYGGVAEGGAAADGGSSEAGDSDGGGEGEDGGTEGGQPGARCESSQLGPRMLRRLTQGELERTLRDVFPELGADWTGVRLGPDPLSELGFSNDAQMLQVGNQTAEDLFDTAIDVAERVTAPAVLGTILPCATTSPDESCADELVARYGRRLFRRPLTADELAAYRTLFAENRAEADFPTAVRWVLVALIQSPHAVYRSELGAPDGDGFALDDHELATALAYDFSGTTPSEALLAAAEAGELRDPEVRVQWARDLLDAPGGRAWLHRFGAEWSGYERVATTTKTEVPEWDVQRRAMVDETRALIEAVWFEDEGDVRALLTADFTVVDPSLAAFYGWAPPAEHGRVDRPTDWGTGLLAQGAMLAAFAHADASSPTRRGLVVFRRLLCQDVPPPPAGIPPIEDAPTEGRTTRERYEDVHAANNACKGCHDQFDPIGFGFEHFDAVGRYRADEHGLAIDATGSVVIAGERVPFDGLDQLATILAERDEVTDCVSGLAASWVFGGGGGQSCLAESGRTALSAGEIGMVEYVARMAAEPHFATRRAGE